MLRIPLARLAQHNAHHVFYDALHLFQRRALCRAIPAMSPFQHCPEDKLITSCLAPPLSNTRADQCSAPLVA
eukprot:1759209-Amphidinium_carterae.3